MLVVSVVALVLENRSWLKCKKDLHMGADLTEETVIRRLVAWELQAQRFDGDANPRHAHVFSRAGKEIRRRSPSPP